MKVYISCDMEGISGVVAWEQTGRLQDRQDYERARLLMTLEVNAAVEGALQAGATEVVVNDSHGGMRNILIEHIHKDARLISGSTKFMSMMEGIDSSYGAAFFVGYHARMGRSGILSHTYSTVVSEYRVNDTVFGETGMNALVAGHYGVPVVLVTGDSAVAEEAKSLLGEVRTVAVKEPVSRYAAKCLQPEKARSIIQRAAKQALETVCVTPLRISSPVKVAVKFVDTGCADDAEVLPHSVREDDLTVSYTDDNYLTCLRAARVMMTLAGR